MRDITPDVQGRGAFLGVVGNGSTEQAARFATERDLPFPLYTDPGLRAYRAAGLRRDMASTLNVGLLKHSMRAMRSGHFQGMTQGDPWQQGGAFVIGADGTLRLRQISETAGDHVDPGDLLEALPAGGDAAP